MPSTALLRWQNERASRLTQTDTHCQTFFTTMPNPLLAEESLQAYVLLLSGHFQGFCRDLYTECSQICTSFVPPGLSATVQAQFAAELKVNSGNPTLENIRKDFKRFGFLLHLGAADPANPARITYLGHLHYWRNVAAHQKPPRPPTGVPTSLVLADVRNWRASCDGLATSLDSIMYRELLRILGRAPW